MEVLARKHEEEAKKEEDGVAAGKEGHKRPQK